MEDISRVQKQPASPDDGNKKVIDLTSEMVIDSEKGGKIYDLTQTLDGTALAPPEITGSREAKAGESDATPSLQPENAPQNVSDIEKEVDVAFENIEPYRPIDLNDGCDDKKKAVDKVDDLQQMADDVLNETSPAPETEAAEPVEPSGAEPDVPLSIFSDRAGEADVGEDISAMTDTDLSRDMPEVPTEQIREPLPTPQMEADPAKKDAIIDLVDIISAPQSEEAKPEARSEALGVGDEEDEIIELVDVVSTKPRPAEVQDAMALPMDIDEDRENLAQPTDNVARPFEVAPPETDYRQDVQPGPDSEAPEGDQWDQREQERPPIGDQVIQLSEIIQNSRKENTAKFQPELDTAQEDDQESVQDLSAGIGMVLGDQPSEIPDDAIEAAVERYIRSRYGGDLERMIAAVVEKTVSREIENLKRNFMNENEEPK